MTANVVQFALLGQCRVDLVRITEAGDDHWMVFFRTPSGARIDTLSRVLRQIGGGHFGNLGPELGLVYDGPTDAHAAFGALLDTVSREAGAPARLSN